MYVFPLQATPARTSHRGNSTKHRLNFRCKDTIIIICFLAVGKNYPQKIEQLVKECARVNEIDINSTVKIDPATNDYGITIPKYKIDPETDNITFILGTIEQYINENYQDLTETQRESLIAECIKRNDSSRFATVTFDPEENKYNIAIPKFKINDDELEFIEED